MNSIFILCCIVLNFTRGIKFTDDIFRDLTPLLIEGREQLEVLSRKTTAPEYGKCWSRAVSALESNCRHLTEQSQSALALRLTDCFLQMSGHGPILCDVPRQECLKQISDRAFNAYTEFYTHTQNICYFLQSKVWHEEAEKTINRLTSTSIKVSSQLVEAEKSQSILLKQQRESLLLQESLGSTLQSSRETIILLMNELQQSAIEQKGALFSLFEQLENLQSWIVGEVSWIDSIIFYCSTAILLFLFTSSQRTQRSRLLLFSILTINYLTERYLCQIIKYNEDREYTYVISDNLNNLVWYLRQFCVTVCALLLVVFAITYSDFTVLNHELLLEIKKQNNNVINLIKQKNPINGKSLNSDGCDKLPPTSTFENKTTAYTVINSPTWTENKLHSNKRLTNLLLHKIERRSIDVESNHSKMSDSDSDVSVRSIRRSLRLQRAPI